MAAAAAMLAISSDDGTGALAASSMSSSSDSVGAGGGVRASPISSASARSSGSAGAGDSAGSTRPGLVRRERVADVVAHSGSIGLGGRMMPTWPPDVTTRQLIVSSVPSRRTTWMPYAWTVYPPPTNEPRWIGGSTRA